MTASRERRTYPGRGRRAPRGGQAIVEFALVVPVLLALVIAAITLIRLYTALGEVRHVTADVLRLARISGGIDRPIPSDVAFAGALPRDVLTDRLEEVVPGGTVTVSGTSCALAGEPIAIAASVRWNLSVPVFGAIAVDLGSGELRSVAERDPVPPC